MKFIIDFEGYQVHGVWYPVEIALLNTETKVCFVHYVYYYHNYNNSTTQYQFKRHGLHWSDGYEALSSALLSISQKLTNTDSLHVKGHEKAEIVRQWFPNICVVEMDEKAIPSLLLMTHSKDAVCYRHARDTSLCCARRKAWQLMEYEIGRAHV